MDNICRITTHKEDFNIRPDLLYLFINPLAMLFWHYYIKYNARTHPPKSASFLVGCSDLLSAVVTPPCHSLFSSPGLLLWLSVSPRGAWQFLCRFQSTNHYLLALHPAFCERTSQVGQNLFVYRHHKPLPCWWFPAPSL